MTLDPTLVAGIEYDLRHYKRWKARLKEIDDILKDVPIGSPKFESVGYSGSISDPTFKQAYNRNRLEQEKAWIDRMVSRVENAMAAMTEQQQELIIKRYFEDKPRKAIEAEMGIEKTTFYRLREQALEVYAEVAGLIPISGQK